MGHEQDGLQRAQVRRKAEQLMRDAGIPRPLAFQVASGALTLNDVLQRMALRDKVTRLIEQHDLPRSLATQIAMGQADLDSALAKRRRKAWMAEHGGDSILDQAQQQGDPLMLWLHGGQVITARILDVDKYELRIQPKGQEPQVLHKLQVRLAAWPAEGMKLRSSIKRDKSYDGPTQPIERPQDRYSCSDRRLFHYVESQHKVDVTVLEGDHFHGTVSWISRWEFGVNVKKGLGIVVFRHALTSIKES